MIKETTSNIISGLEEIQILLKGQEGTDVNNNSPPKLLLLFNIAHRISEILTDIIFFTFPHAARISGTSDTEACMHCFSL